MRHSLRNIIALGFSASVMMGLVLPGCSGRLGPVRVTQNGGSLSYANLEQTKECVAEYGQQMAAGRIDLDATVKVDEDGDLVGVRLDGIPNTAPDFGACLRHVLREMPIAEQPFREGVKMLDFSRKHARDSQEALVRFLEVIPGVPIVESEVVLEADGYTVVLPVTVKVVAKLETSIDGDKRTMAQLGRMAIDTVGYGEIMKRAEQVGWVKTVHVEQAQLATSKRLLADGATAVAGSQLTMVFSRYAFAAGVSAAADSPVPGPGDAVAVGILVIGLIHMGVLTAQQIVITQQAEAQRCREVKEKCISHCSGPAGLPAPGGGRFRGCMRECMESQGCSY